MEAISNNATPGTRVTISGAGSHWDSTGGDFTNRTLFTVGNNQRFADGDIFATGLNYWQIDYDAFTPGFNFATEATNSYPITLPTVVPEPGAASAVLTGLGVLLALPRIRRRRA